MNPQSLPKKFVFHEQVDRSFIFNLYEHDYAYILEVYQTSLDALAEDLPRMHHAIAAGDVQTLKKAVHKIKPVFGFTGLLTHQQRIAELEAGFEQPQESQALTALYTALTATLTDGQEIMEQELKKLTAFVQ